MSFDVSEYQRRYRAANKEKIIKDKRRYYLANKQRVTEKNRLYRLANRQKILEAQRRWYLANREKIIEKQHCYYLANKQEVLEQAHRYNRRCIIFKGKHVSVPYNPRTGTCSKCLRSIVSGEIKRTSIHHTRYDVENPLANTVELCNSCHVKRHAELRRLKIKL